MQATIKIVLYWILIGVCFILHNSLHQLEIHFGKSLEIVEAAGVLPLGAHIFTILVSTSPFILAFLFLNFSSKILSWGSFVWSVLFLILNAAHLVEAIVVEKPFNLSQVVLLLFIVIVNASLAFTLWKNAKIRKEEV